jgi:hypothetical protein
MKKVVSYSGSYNVLNALHIRPIYRRQAIFNFEIDLKKKLPIYVCRLLTINLFYIV